MILKGGLAPKRKLSDLKHMGHDLKKLWEDYKADFPDDPTPGAFGCAPTARRDTRSPPFLCPCSLRSGPAASPAMAKPGYGLGEQRQHFTIGTHRPLRPLKNRRGSPSCTDEFRYGKEAARRHRANQVPKTATAAARPKRISSRA